MLLGKPQLGISTSPQKLKVFISYARRDLPFARQLVAGLEACDIEVLIDERDLPLAVEFKQELLGFIRTADSIVFVVSSASILSPWCAWEIEQVQLLNKRLAPVVLEPVDDDKVPEGIRKLNYVFFTGDAAGSQFQDRCSLLARALKTDVPWIKEHTRIGEAARRWEEGGRSNAQLLRGAELQAAETWSTRQPLEAPALSDRHRAFISESRTYATRRQRFAVAGSLSAAIFALTLAGFALWAKRQADTNAALAQTNAQEASRNFEVAQKSEVRAVAEQRKAEIEKDAARRSESVLLADQSLREINTGAPKKGVALALKALPSDLRQPDRPFLPRAEFALARASIVDRSALTLSPGEDRANYAEFSSDGQMIVSGSRDGIVRIWDAKTGNILHSFFDDRKAVYSVKFSGDGSLIATAYGGPNATIVVRNVATGEVVADLKTGNTVHDRILFWPDNSKLVSSAKFGDINPRVWDLKTGRLLVTLESKSSWMSRADGLILAPDQKTLMQTGIEITVWDANTYELIAPDLSTLVEMTKKNELVLSAGYHGKNGTLIAQGRTTIYEFDLHEKRRVNFWDYSEAGINIKHGSAISPGGETIAVMMTDREPALFRLKDGSNKRVLRGHTAPVAAMTFSPDGSQIATTASDNTVRIWDNKTGRQLALLRDHAGFPRGVAYASDGNRLMILDEKSIHLYDTRPDKLRLARVGPGTDWQLRRVDGAGARALYSFAPEGDARRPTKLVLWDISANRSLASVTPPADHSFDCGSAEFSADGTRVAIHVNSNGFGSVQIFDAVTGTAVALLKPQGSLAASALSTDGGVAALVATEYDKERRESKIRASVWDTASQTKRLEVENVGIRGTPVLSPDGAKLVLVMHSSSAQNQDIDILLWDVASGTKLAQVRRHFESNPDVWFLSGSSRMLVSSDHTAPLLFDTQTGQALGNLEGQHLGAKNALSPPDGKNIIVTRDRGPASIWSTQNGRLVATLPERNQEVEWVLGSANSERLLTKSLDYSTRESPHRFDIFDITTGERKGQIGPFNGINFVRMGPRGRRVAVGFDRTSTSVYDVERSNAPRKLQHQAPFGFVDFADQEERIITADHDGHVQIWDAGTGMMIGKGFSADKAEPISFFTSGSNIFGVHGADSVLHVVRSLDGNDLCALALSKYFEMAQISRDNTVVAIADHTGIQIFATVSGERIDRQERNPGLVKSIQTTEAAPVFFVHVPKGNSFLYDYKSRKIVGRFDNASKASFLGKEHNRLAVISGNKLEVSDVVTGDTVFAVDLNSTILLLAGDPAGEAVAVATADHRVLAFSLTDGRQFFVKGPMDHKPQWITFGNNSSRLTVFEDEGRALTLWNTSSGEAITNFSIDWADLSDVGGGRIWRMADSKEHIAVVNPDNAIDVYLVKDGKSIFGNSFSWDTQKIAGVMFINRGRLLLVVTDQGRVLVWNIEKYKGETVVELNENELFYNLSNSKFIKSANSGLSAVIGKTGLINVISSVTFVVRQLFAGESETNTTGVFNADGTLLATLCDEGVLRVWSTSQAEVMFELRDPNAFKSSKAKLRFSSDGRRLIIEPSYYDGQGFIFEMPEVGELLIARSRKMLSAAADASAAPGVVKQRLRLGIMMIGGGDQIRSNGVDTATGAFVSEVEAASPAEAAGIRTGDIILEVDGRPMKNVDDVAAAIKASSGVLVLKVMRQSDAREIRVRLND